MTFLIVNDGPSSLWERVEINTLAELKAFALGGNGTVSISYLETDDNGDRMIPVLRRGKE